MASTQQPLNLAGKIFFGSLCVGTFGLGVWQTIRYNEKQEMIKERNNDLQAQPIPYLQYNNNNDNYNKNCMRRIVVQGQYDHTKEALVGPRGPPIGALPDKPGSSAQGMSSAPQGYYVLTPLHIMNNDNNVVVVVNRGWIPKHLVLQKDNNNQYYNWDRPKGYVQVTTVPSKLEEPKFLVAQHKFHEQPPQLYWFDFPAILAIMGIVPKKDTLQVVTQIADDDDESRSSNNNNNDYKNITTQQQQQQQWPVQSPINAIGEFKVTPQIHMAYAFTWYSLSAAGLYMTRKLITKGRA